MKQGGDILILHGGELAEFVAALPAMKALRRAYRGARLMLIARPPVSALGGDTPYVDEVIELESFDDPRELARVVQRLKLEKFECIFDLERTESSEKLFAAMKPFPAALVRRGAGHEVPL